MAAVQLQAHTPGQPEMTCTCILINRFAGYTEQPEGEVAVTIVRNVKWLGSRACLACPSYSLPRSDGAPEFCPIVHCPNL